MFMNEEKSGKVGFAFAYPIFDKVKNIHLIYAQFIEEGKILFNGKSFRFPVT